MKKIVILTILLINCIMLTAVTQGIYYRGNNVAFEFENINIDDIEFYDGHEIQIQYSEKENLEIEKIDKKIIFKAKEIVKIDLELPISKTYTFTKSGKKVVFDAQSVKILDDDKTVIEFYKNEILVNNGDEEQSIKIGSDGILVSGEEEYIEIGSNGIIVENEDESKHLTGFWGKLLGGSIKWIVKLSTGWIGKNPNFIVKHIINDENDMDGTFVNIGLSDKGKFTKEFSTTYKPKKDIDLNVQNLNGSIMIKSWDEEQIDISAMIKSNKSKDELEKVKIEITDKGGCTIKTAKKKPNPRVFVEYTLKVPKDVRLHNIKTSNGIVQIMNCVGDMLISSSNGNIEVYDSKGSFTANTSNAKIEFVNLDGPANAQTSNGKIRVVRTPQLKEAFTSNGKILIELDEQISDDIYLSTSNGAINIELDPSLDLSLDATTTNSHIDIDDIEIMTSEFSNNRLLGRRNQGGKKITAKTSNARIKISKLEK